MDRTPKTLHVCPTAWDIDWEATAAFREKRVNTTEYIHKDQLIEWLEGEKQEYDPNNAYEAAYTISHNAAIDTVIEKVIRGDDDTIKIS